MALLSCGFLLNSSWPSNIRSLLRSRSYEIALGLLLAEKLTTAHDATSAQALSRILVEAVGDVQKLVRNGEQLSRLTSQLGTFLIFGKESVPPETDFSLIGV